jgi:hypothetical protein
VSTRTCTCTARPGLQCLSQHRRNLTAVANQLAQRSNQRSPKSSFAKKTALLPPPLLGGLAAAARCPTTQPIKHTSLF